MLLAKPPGKALTVSLAHHTNSVSRAIDLVCEIYGEKMVKFWRLGITADRLRFLCRSAAWLHDFGKANDHFQNYIKDENPNFHKNPQSLRHESVSVWLASQMFMVKPMVDHFTMDERNAIISAVASHHSKPFVPARRARMFRNPNCRKQVNVFKNDPEFRKFLDNCPFGPIEDPQEDLSFSFHLTDFTAIEKIYRGYRNYVRPKKSGISNQARQLIGCIKSCLIVADVVGSIANDSESLGIAPEIYDLIRKWGNYCIDQKSHDSRVNQEKAAIASVNGGNYVPRKFQKDCGDSTSRVTLLLQGCGSGKTHASNLWAARHAVDKKLFICYPTRDTATTAFHNAGGYENANLIHSLVNSGIDFEAEDMEDKDKENIDPNVLEDQERTEAFWMWSQPRVYCTVDTVLGLFSLYKRSVFLAPCLSNAAFVFDEVHSYDTRLFQGLRRFLKDFDAPSLLMTASLTEERRKTLLEDVPDINEVREENRQDEIQDRYKRVDTGDHIAYAVDAFKQGKKVLVIVNTVERAMNMADYLEEVLETPVECYHSRYPYLRREEIRSGMVNDLYSRNNPNPVVAVTTQVAQVSLDISCDLLITELAPVCDLIQRLGRLNRWGKNLGEYIVVEPESVRPYEEKDLVLAREWLEKIPGIASQVDLDKGLKDVESKENFDDVELEHNLLDQFDSQIGEIREDRVGLEVLLNEHLDLAQHCPSHYMIRMNLPTFECPFAKKRVLFEFWERWEKIHHAYIPKSYQISYNPKRGAKWTL